MPKKKSNAGRRKIQVTKKMIEVAEECASFGLNKKQIATKLCMGETTLYDRIAEYPELLKAINRGQTQAVENVTNALYNTAMDGNTVAQIFFLKNRGEWRDKSEVEMTGEVRRGMNSYYDEA